MTSPSGSRENESSLHVRLAQASILALGQSLRPDTPPGETPFVLIPGMMPYSYDDTARALASKSRPMVLYGFRALGALVIGTWRASEDLERFAWQARGDQQMTRSTAHLYGRQDDAKFLVQWVAKTSSCPSTKRFSGRQNSSCCSAIGLTGAPLLQNDSSAPMLCYPFSDRPTSLVVSVADRCSGEADSNRSRVVYAPQVISQ